MATTNIELNVKAADLRTTLFPQWVRRNGTNIPVAGWAFDAGLDEGIYFRFVARKYGSGNVTVDVDWYADTASANSIVLGAALAVITPDTDSQDVETDALAAEATVTDTHLGTVGKRLHRATITITALDSLAANDHVVLRVRRIGSSGSDNMAGDAIVTYVGVSYSDT